MTKTTKYVQLDPNLTAQAEGQRCDAEGLAPMLTEKEKIFLNGGGELWSTHERDDGLWEMMKIGANSVYIFPSVQRTKAHAEQFIYNFANLSENQHLLGIHHSVARSSPMEQSNWPAMI